jgi:hypothetical protein
MRSPGRLGAVCFCDRVDVGREGEVLLREPVAGIVRGDGEADALPRDVDVGVCPTSRALARLAERLKRDKRVQRRCAMSAMRNPMCRAGSRLALCGRNCDLDGERDRG